jgi:hypothetical protein
LSDLLDIDNISIADLVGGMQRATRDCQKGEYSKGEHSFQILARIDPERVSTSIATTCRAVLYGVGPRVYAMTEVPYSLAN